MVRDAYERAGVSITAGEEVVENIQKQIKDNNSHVVNGIGDFAGSYQLSGDQLEQPVLVASSDGVGTKVLLAAQTNRVEHIGQDLLAMCVNDLLAQGANPLFFLDYLATSHIEKNQIEKVLNGIIQICENESIALLGGETAEMPGLYQENHFDLAGFSVGLAKPGDLFKPEDLAAGDYLIGLPSSGLHSNGYSLVRQILFKDNHYGFTDEIPEIGRPLVDELLQPTRLYTKIMRLLLSQHLIGGAAHITGGGLIENVPRMLSNTLKARINPNSWTIPPIFSILKQAGGLNCQECFRTFNMGIGMVLVVKPHNLNRVLDILNKENEEFYQIGSLEKRLLDTEPISIEGVV